MTAFIAKTSSVDYEVAFKTPFFNLARANVEVLQALFKQIAPAYTIRSSDMFTVAGNALSQVSTKVTLFRGSGTMEVTADKFSASFRDALPGRDMPVVTDCVTRALQALIQFVPESQLGNEVIRLSTFLSLCDGAAARDELFASMKVPRFTAPNVDLTKIAVRPAFKVEFHDNGGAWIVGAEVSGTWHEPDGLLALLIGNFFSGAGPVAIADRAKVMSEMADHALNGVGLQANTTGA